MHSTITSILAYVQVKYQFQFFTRFPFKVGRQKCLIVRRIREEKKKILSGFYVLKVNQKSLPWIAKRWLGNERVWSKESPLTSEFGLFSSDDKSNSSNARAGIDIGCESFRWRERARFLLETFTCPRFCISVLVTELGWLLRRLPGLDNFVPIFSQVCSGISLRQTNSPFSIYTHCSRQCGGIMVKPHIPLNSSDIFARFAHPPYSFATFV